MPPALNESAVVSLRPIASRTRLSRKAGTTPSPAETTISRSTPPSRSLYGTKSGPMRRKFARRLAGSAGRSGDASAEWKNMPIQLRVRLGASGSAVAIARGDERLVSGVPLDVVRDERTERHDLETLARRVVQGRCSKPPTQAAPLPGLVDLGVRE